MRNRSPPPPVGSGRFKGVVGHPDYYPRFGFSPARAKGFAASFPVPDEAFMPLELRPGAADAGGNVIYSPAFEVCDEDPDG
ncbi:hypothetical protein [Methanoculleus sp. MH98A]|uniref:hypothetical protein n=1 Tax=Methanoculleus sp. MH98A TaxID=1495314 RepID=UPI0004A0B2C8|nr:hypothetical protein [Methanoculleus sp. MH98A]KDE55791.1 hypothetical protein EI28_04615 [Methanoculleus sp. MH98A]